MTKEAILAFLNANPLCYLATVDGDKARVRGMMLFTANEDGILFHANAGKDLITQLRANPNCELCVFNPEQNVQVRVSGVAQFLDDLALKQQMVAERPFLQGIVDRVGYDAFLVFLVTDCVATVWTMADAMAPKTFVRLSA